MIYGFKVRTFESSLGGFGQRLSPGAAAWRTAVRNLHKEILTSP